MRGNSAPVLMYHNLSDELNPDHLTKFNLNRDYGSESRRLFGVPKALYRYDERHVTVSARTLMPQMCKS